MKRRLSAVCASPFETSFPDTSAPEQPETTHNPASTNQRLRAKILFIVRKKSARDVWRGSVVGFVSTAESRVATFNGTRTYRTGMAGQDGQDLEDDEDGNGPDSLRAYPLNPFILSKFFFPLERLSSMSPR
ncbi:MAG: hypothetical protein H0U13_02860 [Gemmatimonadaceae bacterium]|nr:hypothetical protein [Gemmatimonadaceae bacterium]